MQEQRYNSNDQTWAEAFVDQSGAEEPIDLESRARKYCGRGNIAAITPTKSCSLAKDLPSTKDVPLVKVIFIIKETSTTGEISLIEDTPSTKEISILKDILLNQHQHLSILKNLLPNQLLSNGN
ncbi:uncharacterized protein G6M90_00g097330 [Metarhizium brunneum]|uniref:Uncharacterized protein n=1 Tax=Metarhizium brunneum TaxID=500148 RepID=A0A7D5V230_9HYPO|nr:hypothetical protein G6M90_00g097330 [Metarhizium brunneum]